MEAIVLAGGLGTRLRAAVPDRPKPMADVRGRPFLEHLMDWWIQQGVTRWILSVGYLHEQITAHFGTSYRGIPIAYAVESHPLGTGGALSRAIQQVISGGPFLVLNGDTYFPVPLSPLLAAHRDKLADATMVLRHVQNNDRYGSVELNAQGQITAFTSGGPLINGGIYLLDKSLPLATDPCSLEQHLFPRWITYNRVFGYQAAQSFIDIGIPIDYHRFANSVLESTS